MLADSVGTEGLLFLLWGGLVLTAVNVAVLLLHARGPLHSPARRPPSVLVAPRAPPRRAREAAPASGDHDFESGRIAGKRVRSRSVDGALDGFAAAGLGDPRILRSVPGYKLVRVSSCRSCEGARSGPCEFERAFLSSALETILAKPVRAKETACGRRDGSGRCDFEVTY